MPDRDPPSMIAVKWTTCSDIMDDGRFWGLKQTCAGHLVISPFDPKQTSAPAWQVGKVSKRGQRVPTGCDPLAAETSQGRPLDARAFLAGTLKCNASPSALPI